MSSDLLQQHQLIEQKFQQLTQKATQVEAFIKQQSTASSSSSFDVSQLIPRLQQIRILVQQQAQEIQQTLADSATLTTENQYLEKQIESLLQTLNQVEQSSSSSSTIMSENKPVTTPNVDKEQAKKDKKAAKDAKKAEKDAKKSAAQQAATRTAPTVTDPINCEFGDLALVQSQYKTERKWYNIGDIDEKLVSQNVWIRARAHNIRAKGNAVFIVLRRGFSTIQCAAFARDGGVSKDLVKFASKISSESIVDVQGEVTKVETPTKATQSTVEIQIKKLFVVSLAAPLPFQIEDAARPEPTAEEAAAEKIAAEKKAAAEAEAAKNKGKKQEKKDEKEEDVIIRVSQDTRLDNRWIDLRTPANHAIFRLQSRVCQYFRNFLIDRDFVEIHTPKITPGVSEGGAEVFRLDYFGQPACLAQSPQLYKQMGVTSDLFRVFEIGPVFRAENSNTHRHMCEFVGMDFEMEIKEHYHEVTKILGDVMVAIFDGINKNHKAELAAVGAQYPFEPLQYLPETLIFSHREAVELLRGDGINIGYDDDFSTAQEKHLGKLVKAKWKTDFYIVDQYPITARPFYTMPNPTNPKYTNSYDVFIRGEEITSGAQRIHEVELLQKRASECGIPASNIAKYLESFRYGAVPHGGAGVGLERVVMLFLGLDNIRKTSMFPRTPTRHEP